MLRRALVTVLLMAGAAAAVAVLDDTGHAPGAPSGPALAHPYRLPVPRRHHRRAVPRGWIHGAAARRVAIPILMYHVIGHRPPWAPFPQLWTSPQAFRAQLRGIARLGERPITLAQAFAAWRHGAPVPPRPVVLTFDDGYRSDATVVAPMLRRRHWPAVLDLAIRNAGPTGLPLRRLRTLVRDRWEIASHTVTHPDLTTLDRRGLRAELVGSRRWILHRLGVRARFFCYPAGRFDPAVIRAVRAAGYAGATTELPGRATRRSNPFELPRVRVLDASRF